MNQAHNRSPDKEKAHKTLNSTGSNNNPRPTKRTPFRFRLWLPITVRCDGGVKETGKNAEVSSDVFENGNGVKR
jgi:hypothetical protein